MLMTTAIDVTERKHDADQLREAARRKDEFLATLAHELRNPLAPMSNAIAIMQHGAERPGEPSTGARAVIERQLSHLVRLIDDLLDVSRISLDKLKLRVERVDLRRGCSTRGRGERGRWPSAPAQVLERATCRPSPVWLDGDPRAAVAGVRQPDRQRRASSRRRWRPGRGRGRASTASMPVVERAATTASASPPTSIGGVFELFVADRRSLERDAGRPRHRPDAGQAPGRAARRQRRRRRAPAPAAAASSSSRLPLARGAGDAAPSEPAPAARGRRRVACACSSSTTTATAPRAWRCCSRSPATRPHQSRYDGAGGARPWPSAHPSGRGPARHRPARAERLRGLPAAARRGLGATRSRSSR